MKDHDNLKTLNADRSDVSLNAISRFYGNRLNFTLSQLLKRFDAKFLDEQNKRIQPNQASKLRFGEHYCDEFWQATLEFPGITSLRFVMTVFDPNSLQSLEGKSSITEVEIVYSENFDLEMLRGIRQLPSLKKLIVANCELLNHDCLEVFSELKQLEVLDVDLNCLTADDLAELQKALPNTKVVR